MGQLDKLASRYLSDRLRAAEAGEADAYYDLGLAYSTGQGVGIDLIEAHKWFNLAAQKGVRRAVVDRAELAEIMSAADVEEAQKHAREWFLTH